VKALELAEAGPVPMALVARTVHVYVVPLARPVTVMGDEAPLADPPGLQLTEYPVIGEPPLDAGAVKVTVASPLPAVAVPIVGAPGASGRPRRGPVLPSRSRALPNPGRSAVTVRVPAKVEASEQLPVPAASVIEHVTPRSSCTVTVPEVCRSGGNRDLDGIRLANKGRLGAMLLIARVVAVRASRR
jgi:hypothetical protein